MKIRIAYTKQKEAKYIAHLDLNRMLDRALRRAGIEVAYSEGFNPHPKISFGPPLPVGVEGMREYVDIDLKTPEDLQEGKTNKESEQAFLAGIAADLQKQLPEGIDILGFAVRPQGSRAITAILNLARYRSEVPFLEEIHPDRVQEACRSWLAKEEVIGIRYQKGKKTKRNIRPFVQAIEVVTSEPAKHISANLDIRIGNEGSVRPVEIWESLLSLENLPVDLPGVSTTRTGLYIQQQDGSLIDPLEIIKS